MRTLLPLPGTIRMQRKFTLILFATLASACACAQSAAPAPGPPAPTSPGASVSDDEIGVLKVQGNVYMLVTAAGNIAAQEGDDGILVVNTGTEAFAPQVAAALKKLVAKPVLWVVNTDAAPAHIGGNDALPRLSGLAPRQEPRIVAYENVLDRVSHRQPRVPDALWPNDEYFSPMKDFSFNGEAIEVYHVPNALTDGDSMVHFRRSDVLATGDVFTPGRYPVIHTDQGGTIQGELDALNQILRITVPVEIRRGRNLRDPGPRAVSAMKPTWWSTATW